MLQAVVEDRIRDLLRFRRWYRQQANFAFWMDLAHENDRELRALLKLTRKARRLTEGAPDPVTLAKGWQDSPAGAGEIVEAFRG